MTNTIGVLLALLVILVGVQVKMTWDTKRCSEPLEYSELTGAQMLDHAKYGTQYYAKGC
jgi:hypothetical protein